MSVNEYIGIDLGTSGAKFLLVGADGGIIAEGLQTYPVYYPKGGWSEQDPEDWYAAVLRGIKALLEGRDASRVRGLAFGGQMHGLVTLDAEGKVLRPAILWNDGRSARQTEYLNTVIGRKRLSACTANIAYAGFTAPKLMWMRDNEPELYARIASVMLPKDYLVYRLCGRKVTDVSDASGTLFFDVKNRRWSEEACAFTGVKPEWLPEIKESYETAGVLGAAVARELGLSDDVIVCAGAGDNAAAAIGTGTVGDGDCNISLGTSGTIFVASDRFVVDENNSLHSFCHADGKYHLMGCILSAASCNAWWSDKILGTDDYAAEQAGLEELCGKNHVYFLPYLMGERSPHNDVNARGAFIGMRPDTTRKHMTLAVLEGVAFALRDCAEAVRKLGIKINSVTVCGGGAKSALWRQIIADVLNVTVRRLKADEGPAYGAAILAMTACGEFPDVSVAAKAFAKDESRLCPDKARVEAYEKRYAVFRSLYPALKSCYAMMND